ncbi:ComEC/Rec2 family competence protein [Candidatus Saccharibacteria bacterium]|nr:ComEC/Rec2 family competence protein [Candidatus Saccharibacteria bacterium]
MLKILWRDIHQSYFIVMLAIGIVVGTILALVFRINYFASLIWVFFVIILLIFSYLKPKLAFVVIALIAGMILAFFRTSGELEGENYIRQFCNQTILVSGFIKGDPETDENTTKFKLGDLKFGEEEIISAGYLYISESKNENLARGDEITLSGKLSEGFGTYAGYMYKPRIVAWKRAEPGDLILKMRNWFSERISQLVPEPEVKLGLSYLLGMKTGLPEDLSENLRMVGLVHIVVASGAHLSILVEIARKIFGRISRFSGLLFSELFVSFFMAMVGFTPSILRAGVMSILSLLAWYVGRKFEPWRIIIITMATTLMIEPMFIINIGWLLSFASFSGIMILGPKLTKLFYGEKKPKFIASTVITTVSATLMTLPITLYFYGQISLISVLANLLILPTLAYAMGLVLLEGVVSGFWGIETIVSFLATKLLSFHILIVEWFGGMRQFLVEMPKYQWQVFLIYGGIVLMVLIVWLRKKNKMYVKI